MIGTKQMWLWPLVAAGAVLAAGLGGCDGDDGKDGGTAAAGGTGSSSSSASSSTSSSASSGTTSSTGTGGAGGGVDAKLCEEALQKLDDCDVEPGGGGAGDGNVSGDLVECDKAGKCVAQCTLDANCTEIKLGGDYFDCVFCCHNPQLCT
ncbi:MAG: hypothetical protein HY744_32910 [Deltaproteobacteria bacterium]|nr:hypothetical protein [Deltaproteobacteria bacterium]